jgi:hypothetical protein
LLTAFGGLPRKKIGLPVAVRILVNGDNDRLDVPIAPAFAYGETTFLRELSRTA